MSNHQNASTQAPPLFPERWAALAVLLAANVMNLIDVSIVNVALPQIQHATGARSTQLEWVAAIYVLALAVGLLPFGRFGDFLGRKRLFLWGLSGFTLASTLCGLAPGIISLIAARGVQGIAAAMMVPQVLAIAHVIFPPADKARVFGLFGILSSLSVVAGPVVGGALISVDLFELGWRVVFLINLPLGLATIAMAMRWVPDSGQDKSGHPDWTGGAIFALVIALVVIPLIEGRVLGWPWWCLASVALSIPAAMIFVMWEKRRTAQARNALIPAGLLKNRVFLIRLALVTACFSGVPGLFLILAVFLQSGLGFAVLESGIATAPFPAGVMLASTLTTRFGDRYPSYRIASGAGLLAIGMAGLQAVIWHAASGINPWLMMPPLLICGFGMGLAVMSLFQVTMAAVDPADAGAGSGAMQAFQQIGAVLGIAIVGQLFFGLLEEDPQAQIGSYVRAAALATWYPIGIFSTLALGIGWSTLRRPPPGPPKAGNHIP